MTMTTLRKMRSFQIILFVVLAFTFSNCMTDDYNLKNGVNTDVTLGGDALSFPLGKTLPIMLSSMIKSDNSDFLITAGDGTYSLEIKDSTQMNVKSINPVTFTMDPFIIEPVSSVYLGNTPTTASSSVKTNNYSRQFMLLNESTDLDKILTKNNRVSTKSIVTANTFYYNIPIQNFDININKYVSTDVKSINILTLKTSAKLVFKVKINKLHGIDSLYFYNYIVKLPKFLKFDDKDVNSDNELILNNVGFSVLDGYTKILTFKVLDFLNTEGKSIPVVNGNLILKRVATMQGSSYIKNTTLTVAEIGTFEIQPSIVTDNMVVSLIDGEIKPVIDPTKKNIKLNLPDVFNQPDNVLDIQNPVITLQVGNSMGFLVDAGLNMIPKSKGVIITKDTIPKINFSVPPAAILGQTTWTKYWISKSNTGVSNGYIPLESPKLPLLFNIAPDEIDINVTSVISGNRQIVDLYSQKNKLNINYNVKIPLDFGKNFSILFQDTLGNFKKDLEQFVKMTKQVEMEAVIDNKIPLKLNFEVIPMDISNKAIAGISVSTPDTIQACITDGTARRSTINLVMKETVAGSLSQMNSLQFKVWAKKTSDSSGILLNANQSVVVDIKIKIPKGLLITQN